MPFENIFVSQTKNLKPSIVNTAEHRYEQIEAYLRGQLPPGEVAAFEAEMAGNPDLTALVQQHRLERQGLELLVERDLFAQMQSWDREIALQQPVLQVQRGGRRPLVLFMRIAAVLALAVFGWWLLRENDTGISDSAPPIVQKKPEIRSKTPSIRKSTSPKPIPAPAAPEETEDPESGIAEQTPSEGAQPDVLPAPVYEIPETAGPDYAALADEFYRERDFIPPSGSKGGGSASYQQALDNYRAGRYSDATSKLLPGAATGTDALLQKELMAHSLYKSGQYAAALPYLSNIISTRSQPYAQRAEWAMVLTLLHQMPEKKTLLDKVLSGILANPRHGFYSQARALKGKME